MRKTGPSTALALAAALAVGASLSGCVQQPPPVVPTTTPSVAPVFKSDAAALAAAKKTLDGYLKVSDVIGNQGGGSDARLAVWETKRQYSRDHKVFAGLAAKGESISGSSSYFDLRIQNRDQDANGDVEIRTYVCLDVSHTRLLDKHGKAIANGGPTVAPLVVTFKNRNARSTLLLIDRSVSWDGSNFCSQG